MSWPETSEMNCFGLKVTNKSNHTVWVKEEHTGGTHPVPPRGTWPSRAGSVKT